MLAKSQRREIESAINNDNLEQAQLLISNTYANESSDPEALKYLSQIYIKNGQFSDAIRSLAYAHRLKPDHTEYATALAKVYYDRKKIDKAHEIVRKVLNKEPYNLEANDILLKIEARQKMINRKRNHVIITGTGRSGTTLLVKLLTKLGLHTGFTEKTLDSKTDKNARAGLEQNILENAKCAYIVKSPLICDQIDEISNRTNIEIDHAFIPIRDIKAAAMSRLKVYEDSGNKEFIPGGIWQTSDPSQQENILTDKLFSLLIGLAKMDTPVTLLQYPKLTQDPTYLHKKLNPILKNISLETFTKAFNETVDKKLVHQMTENDI